MYSQPVYVEPAKNAVSYSKFLKNTVLGTIFGIFSVIVLLFLFSFLLNNAFDDPTNNMSLFVAAATSLGSFAGGFFASVKYGGRGFFCGLTTGFFMSLVLFFLMFIFADSDEPADFVFRLINILLQILFSCAGGIFAANRKTTKKTTRKKR